MRVKVRLFARLREIAGATELERDVPPGSTPETVWVTLAREFPELAPYRGVTSCALNEEYAPFSAPMQEGDEVAFLPPVSGGSPRQPRARTSIRDEG